MKIYVLLLAVILMGCPAPEPIAEYGSLNLTVNIGPFCNIEPCNKTPEEFKKLYENYSIVISKSKAIILEQKLTYNGKNGELKVANINVGEYQITISPSDIFTGKGLPKTIVIEKAKDTTLDLIIDTGIR
jgi:hypothetical protein